MTLYRDLKDQLPPHKTALSDAEFILLDRKDFHLSQISPVQPFVAKLGGKLGYPFRVMLSFLDQFCMGLKGADFNIVLIDPKLILAAYYIFLRSGGDATKGRLFAPNKVAQMPKLDGIFGEIYTDMWRGIDVQPRRALPQERATTFTYVITGAKDAKDIVMAADIFENTQRGLLLIKDYAKVTSVDERDYLDSKGLFPSVTFEGHGFCLKLT